MSRARLVTILLFLLPANVIFLTPSQAQVPVFVDGINLTTTPSPGSGHDYIKMLNETVNPANGSLSVRIEAPTPKQRGDVNFPFYIFGYDTGGVSFPTGQISYTSQGNTGFSVPNLGIEWEDSVFHGCGLGAVPGGFLANGGIGQVCSQNVALSAQILPNASAPNAPLLMATCSYVTGFVYKDPRGGSHPLKQLQWTLQNGGGASEGCSWFGEPAATPFGTTGTDLHYQATMWPLPSSVPGCTAGFCPESPTYITDSHGRGGSSNSASPEDTNGNYALNIQPTIVNGRITSIAIPGLANPYTFTYGTTTRNYTPSSALVSSVSVGNCVSVLGKDQETVPVVQAITLPNGQQYQFLYDSTYGVLKTITYPTGATVQYTWAEQPASESLGIPAGTIYCAYVHGWPYVQKRVVSFDGVTPALEQDFQYQTLPTLSSTTGQWTQKITTVTTKDLLRPGTPSFQTIYTYSPMSLTDPSFGMFIGQSAVENRIVYQDWNGSVLQTVTKNWALESPDSVLLSQCVTLPNNLTAGTFYSYGNLDVVTDKKEYDYGILSSSACAQGTQPPTPTATRETVMTPQSFQTTPLYPTGPSIFDRFSTVKIYANGASGTLMSETDLAYDVQSIECAGYPSCVTPANHDETGYGINSTAPRGNLTSAVEKCFNGPCSSGNSTSTYVYDQTGQVLSATDACGNGTCNDMPSAASHTTTYSYADNYSSCGGAPPSSSPTNAYVTLIKDPLGHTTTYCYGYDDGQLRGAADPNLQTTTYIYNTKPSGCGFQDMLGRVGEIDYPDLGKEYICYNDSPFNNSTPSPSVTTTRTINSSTNLATLSAMDGMGRVVQTRLTSDPDGVTYTDTAYDGLGRPYQVYNPTRCNPPTTNCGEPTWGVTTTFYDGLGRTCLVVPPDGALPSSSLCPTAGSQPLNTVLTTYSGNTTMVTDQTGKARETVTDGLGRLTQVFEDPGSSPHLNYETDYRYDALNNLLCVAQNNAGAFSGCSSLPASWRPRTFTYDSLSRLTSATNPESGTITYSYDPNENLSTKISPAPNQTGTATVTASYTYDPLNRLTQKSFSDGTTPTLKYGYDAIALTGCTVAPPALTDSYPVGRRTAMCDGGGSESWSHDKLGRLLTASRTTNSISKSFLYTYNFDGSQYQMTYPNQSSVTYTQGGAGRPLQLVGNGVTITANAHYLPNGDLCYRQDDWDGSWTTTKTFNNRFQPVTIQSVQMFSGTPPPVCGISPIYSGGCCSSKLDLKYSFTDATGHNNGNVVEIYNNLNMERTQLFSYDSLNRLATAETLSDNQPWYQGDDNLTNCWGEQYTYDAWGNFSAITPVSSLYTGCNQESLSMLPTTKNQLQDTNNDYVYDSAGNLTQPGPIGGPYVYDAENHLTSAGGVTYTYDGDGNRVMKSNGTIYWYGANSASLMESDLSGNVQRWYYFFDGQRVARQLTTNEVGFYMTDHLGNVRYLSGCCTGYNIEYYPFGGVILNTDTGDDRYQFSGKERDSESGLDNFGARFNSSSFGRFTSPDPKILSIRHIINPQKWNKYAYTVNNPLNFFDPDGLEERSLWAKIADAFHVQGSVGVGLGATVKVSGVNVEVEASMKSQGTLSAAGNVTVSVVKEAGVSVEAFKEIAVGYKKGSETVTVKDGKPVENIKTESTDVVGLSTGHKSSSVDDHNVELTGAGVCVLMCAGVSIGIDTQKAGVAASAVGDALADAIKTPQPPPPAPPAPPPPACAADKDKKCG